METINSATSIRLPWNKGKLVGQKAPFKLKEIWAIRVRGTSELKWMTRLKWRSKLTCGDAAPVGSAGRRPTRSGPSTKNSPNEKGTDQRIADPQNATKRNNMSPDMTPTGVRYSLNRTKRGVCRSPSARFHSPPIIRAACRRQRQWVLRALAYIPPRRSHPPTAASPAARRSANAAQAPACRARMNSGI
jgi:hypothetical protein